MLSSSRSWLLLFLLGTRTGLSVVVIQKECFSADSSSDFWRGPGGKTMKINFVFLLRSPWFVDGRRRRMHGRETCVVRTCKNNSVTRRTDGI